MTDTQNAGNNRYQIEGNGNGTYSVRDRRTDQRVATAKGETQMNALDAHELLEKHRSS